ncbi:TlpA family protein disulfide reductase, partial [bacterium]|nr:TlpA family protein disulfide reductase [bacterium]
LLLGPALPAFAAPAQPARSAAVEDDSAAAFDLAALHGKVVYLDFWASWCAPCQKSFPWLNQLQEKYGEQGLVVVGVNVDKDRKKADAFLEKHPADFRIVYDPEGKLASHYDLQGMPSTFMIDRGGNERAAHVGFREKETETLEKTVRLLLAEAAAE